MEKSQAYETRKQLIQALRPPTITECKQELGETLANLVFQECHEMLKADFGLEPPLTGPGDMLWVSPSDLLIGKVFLKPPLTEKHMQALTHQGILEIGHDIELKFWNEMRIEKEKALREREEYLTRMFEVQKGLLITKVREEERAAFAIKIKAINKYYEQQIAELLYEMAKEAMRVERELNSAHEEEVEKLKRKFREQITKIVTQLTTQFLQKLGDQELLLTQLFRQQIKTLKMNRKCAIEFERAKAKEALAQLKHKLHCQNIANLMYVLCRERQNCIKEKTKIEEDYTRQINKLKSIVSSKTREVKKLSRIREKKLKQIEVREKCLVEIIYQFRKLIYLAIQATPTQAEFLLSIQRMMNFELVNYCVSEKDKNNEDAARIAEELKAAEAAAQVENIENIEPEEEEQTEADEIVPSDVLPAVYFNKKMYVREDFRNMLSKGIQIEKTHPLWNDDVDELIKIFKQYVSVEKIEPAPKLPVKDEEKVEIVQAVEAICPKPELVTQATQTFAEKASKRSHSCLSKDISEATCFNEKEIHATDIEGEVENRRQSKARIKVIEDTPSMKEMPKRTTSAISQHSLQRGGKSSQQRKSRTLEFRQEHDTVSRLTLARDSVILRISSFERRTLMNNTSTSKLLEATESVEGEHEASEASPTGESKLLAVCDSIEVIRSQSKAVFEQTHSKASAGEEPAPPVVPLDELAMRKNELLHKAKKPKPKPQRKPAIKQLVQTEPVTNEDFTKRVNSLVNVMARNPSLMRLFVSGGK